MKNIKAYLAGPDVFRNDAIEHGKHLVKLCAKYGVIGLYPLDNVIQEDTIEKTRKAIKDANVSMIRDADVIFANIDSFRGPGADNGTTWELGYAEALGKSIYLYVTNTNNLKTYHQKVIDYYNLKPASINDKDQMFIENFGLPDNLMFGDNPIYSSLEKLLLDII